MEINRETELFPAVHGEPVPESCGVRTAVCLKVSMARWWLRLVLRLCGFACSVNPRGMFIFSDAVCDVQSSGICEWLLPLGSSLESI